MGMADPVPWISGMGKCPGFLGIGENRNPGIDTLLAAYCLTYN